MCVFVCQRNKFIKFWTGIRQQIDTSVETRRARSRLPDLRSLGFSRTPVCLVVTVKKETVWNRERDCLPLLLLLFLLTCHSNSKRTCSEATTIDSDICSGLCRLAVEMSIWTHIKAEFSKESQSDFKESEYRQKRENVYVFLRLPWALEKVKVTLLLLSLMYHSIKQSYFQLFHLVASIQVHVLWFSAMRRFVFLHLCHHAVARVGHVRASLCQSVPNPCKVSWC